MKNYLNLLSGNLNDIVEWVRFATNERKNDINDFNNLNQVFISGRRSYKIPTGASNIDPNKDRVGDISITPTFLYVVVDNGGTAEWRRAALSTF